MKFSTQLHHCCDLKTARELIENGAGINTRVDGKTPLHTVSNPDVVQLLIDEGADVHARDSEGNTPLHLAQNEQVIRLLLSAGADVKARNLRNETPLHLAVRRKENELACARVLICEGADACVCDEAGHSVLYDVLIRSAVFCDHFEHYRLKIDLANQIILHGAEISNELGAVRFSEIQEIAGCLSAVRYEVRDDGHRAFEIMFALDGQCFGIFQYQCIENIELLMTSEYFLGHISQELTQCMMKKDNKSSLGYISGIYIHPDYRRRGLFGPMMKAGMSMMPSFARTIIRAFPEEGETYQERLLRLYERCGFVPVYCSEDHAVIMEYRRETQD